MEVRDGEVLTDEVPSSMSHHDAVVRRVNLALIDAMADLHLVDPRSCGLSDLGKPDGFGQRQVSGWSDRWHRAAQEDDTPAMDEVGRRLAETVPRSPRVSVVHNDLKLDNCQFRPDNPDYVTSVFDWDMATLGDPLFDLGALLVSMGSNTLWALTNSEALDRYTDRSGFDIGVIDWYLAFATWRTAIVLKQLHNRYLSSEQSDDRYAHFESYIGPMADRARSMLEMQAR
jgi:aminoglycoside phosphotransferase (APT) family kinase protein